MFVVCVFEGEDFVRGRNVVVRARCLVYIGRDSSVVEHLTSDAEVQPYICICISLYLFIPPYYCVGVGVCMCVCFTNLFKEAKVITCISGGEVNSVKLKIRCCKRNALLIKQSPCFIYISFSV